MSLTVCGCVAPLVIVLGVWLGIGRHAARDAAPGGPAHDVTVASPRAESRWEVLSEEIARRGDRRGIGRGNGRGQHRTLASAEAMRRRHLAAVLPADARR